MNHSTSEEIQKSGGSVNAQVNVVGLSLEVDRVVLCFLPSKNIEEYPYSDDGIRSAWQSIKKHGISFLLMEELSPFHRTFAGFLFESGFPVGILSEKGRAICPKPFGEGIGITETAARTLAYLAGEFVANRLNLELVDPEELVKEFGKPLVRRPDWKVGPDLVSEKVVSLDHGFLWVGIPKVATRSLLDTFVRKPEHEFEATQINDPLPLLQERLPEVRDLFTFSFVRNPWSRVVSAYLDKLTDRENPMKATPYHNYPGLFPGIEFQEFVRFLVEEECGSDEYGDRHWLSQHKFLEQADGDLIPATIGRLETFDEDLNTIGEKLGVEGLRAPAKNITDLRGGRTKQNTKPQDYYRSFYSPRTRDMIRERYARDIELFGYEF